MPWTPPNQDYPPPKPGEPLLHRAAREGDHDEIHRLIAARSNPNEVFDIRLNPGARPWNATPLMVAAGSGDGATVETVRLLIELGADPKQVVDGRSAASFAAHGLGWNYRPGGDAARLGFLLDQGSPLVFTGRAGRRLVAEAARKGDVERLRLMLDHGGAANVEWNAEEARKEAKESRRQMDEFVKKQGIGPPDVGEGFKDAMAQKMSAMRDEMERQTASAPNSFEIALFEAAASGSVECVRLLLQRGADVKQLDNRQHTALFEAGSAEVVKELARAGVDLRQQGQYSRDALHEQLSDLGTGDRDDGQIKEVCRALIDVGIPLAPPASMDLDRLWHAAFRENLEAVKFLLNLGYPVGGAGRTALHAMCWHWDHGDERDDITREIVRTLLAAGISPNARGDGGNTPLHDSVVGDGANLIAAEELLKAGADVNAQNDEGQTPLVYAYETLFGYAKVTPFLLRHGANPLIANRRGKNALDIARQMIAGENPDWRTEQWKGHPPCGWKEPAKPGDEEYQMLAMMEEAARKFQAK